MQLGEQRPQRQIRLGCYPRVQPVPLGQQHWLAMSANLSRCHIPRTPLALRPLHSTRNTHPKQGRRRPRRSPSSHRGNHSLAKIN
jgi:hypothetical protein